ncbi:ribonuclease P protein component [Mycobacteroides abscessus]|uniref:Ribonuclease P protein component n=3 Tax=Mycobacteroides abscessus TaxID=36809 RepID=RNPA_MYCA9|nr:ribonuclease P protein component [Mycobacteroides abscessus]B1MN96.1 RecName: Full=Ribonuclease P protein component; Short=RNase P protein; Short=RNaseP protein; AltName: Full=Protein C5 [Mycobacteroides abscessus ATCC 19977]NML01524.1 ribonuclease P protein component [Staphylococcus capitis]AEI54911.1 ribonuclease P protein component [Mycobacteroides abscessus]AEI54913.1 ribonuclease P protein component [Mycobacteroides abscessus subsp. bolletii]AEI54916.1 ribonuclease P protein component 
MLPTRHRMTKSSEFRQTVKRGVRTTHADLVIHLRRGCPDSACEQVEGPKVGLIVGKSVGGAVVRHRVSRRLRHAAAELLPKLEPVDRMVIRALPSSSTALSASLRQQLRDGIDRSARRQEPAAERQR